MARAMNDPSKKLNGLIKINPESIVGSGPIYAGHGDYVYLVSVKTEVADIARLLTSTSRVTIMHLLNRITIWAIHPIPYWLNKLIWWNMNICPDVYHRQREPCQPHAK